jgi:GTP-binding protein YchF
MGFSLGIVGLPNVGKSTLFNTLSTARADVSNYPFCTIDPNVGVVTVPDERLDLVQQITKAPKKVPTVIEFTDIAGLVKGAHQGEGLGNQFLSHIREVEAIAHVVRCFSDEGITHVEGSVDPKRDIELIQAELILADLATIDKKYGPLKSAVKTCDKNILKYLHLLEKIKETLVKGNPAHELLPSLTHEDKLLLKDLPLLTFKPVLYVANTDEGGNAEQVKIVEEIAHHEKAKAVAISAKLEAEIQELSPEEAQEFLKSVGLKESGLKRLIRAGYELLDLITFFTANEKEARAWTIKRGTQAPQAAGKIHTDFEKGFIAAEVIHYKDLAAAGNTSAAREKGLLRTEGKNYEVQDGDLILFRFNI